MLQIKRVSCYFNKEGNINYRMDRFNLSMTNIEIQLPEIRTFECNYHEDEHLN